MSMSDMGDVLSAVVIQNGAIIVQTPQTDTLYPQYSITKSLVSLAVGMLIAEGKISLDRTVGEVLHTPACDVSGLTLEKLLSMRSGLNTELLFSDRRTCPDYLSACLAQTVGESCFFYNNANYYLAGRMAEEAAGEYLHEYIVRRIFSPLGITEYRFESDPEGHFFGASGLYLKTQDLAKTGLSILDNKFYPEEWLSTMLHPYSKQYGLGFWLDGDSFYMSGKWGQRCMLYPKQRAVIAFNSKQKDSSIQSDIVRRLASCLN